MKISDHDRYTDVAGDALAHLEGAVDGFLGGMKVKCGDESAEAIFFALETALLLHAARMAAFRKKTFGGNITAQIFSEMAKEHFNFYWENME